MKICLDELSVPLSYFSINNKDSSNFDDPQTNNDAFRIETVGDNVKDALLEVSIT